MLNANKMFSQNYEKGLLGISIASWKLPLIIAPYTFFFSSYASKYRFFVVFI